MSLPIVSEDLIRRNATSQSFSRGEEYYSSGAVIRLTERGNSLQASVEGSDLEPYRVNVLFKQRGME